jgi:hypothetical protein
VKTYYGNGAIATCLLNLCTRWRWVVSFTPLRLYPSELIIQLYNGIHKPMDVCAFLPDVCSVMSRDSSVRIATSYGLNDRMIGVRFPPGAGNFTVSRPALRPTQPPIQWVPGTLSPGVKRSGREGYHLPPSSAEVKECVELYLHYPNMAPWRGAQLKHRGTLNTFRRYFFLTHVVFSDDLHCVI